MKSVIPAIIHGNEIKFIRLGEMEDIDITLDFKSNTMTFERVFYDENAEDWDGKEVYASEIENEMKNYLFCAGLSTAKTFRELQSLFSHKMFA